MAQVINLDKPRQLKFGVVAARQYKKVFGESLITAIRRSFQGDEKSGEVALDLDFATNILWAGLVHEQKLLTIDKAAELLEAYLERGEGTLKDLYERFGEALNESAAKWGFKAEESNDQGKESPGTTPQ